MVTDIVTRLPCGAINMLCRTNSTAKPFFKKRLWIGFLYQSKNQFKLNIDLILSNLLSLILAQSEHYLTQVRYASRTVTIVNSCSGVRVKNASEIYPTIRYKKSLIKRTIPPTCAVSVVRVVIVVLKRFVVVG